MFCSLLFFFLLLYLNMNYLIQIICLAFWPWRTDWWIWSTIPQFSISWFLTWYLLWCNLVSDNVLLSHIGLGVQFGLILLLVSRCRRWPGSRATVLNLLVATRQIILVALAISFLVTRPRRIIAVVKLLLQKHRKRLYLVSDLNLWASHCWRALALYFRCTLVRVHHIPCLLYSTLNGVLRCHWASEQRFELIFQCAHSKFHVFMNCINFLIDLEQKFFAIFTLYYGDIIIELDQLHIHIFLLFIQCIWI